MATVYLGEVTTNSFPEQLTQAISALETPTPSADGSKPFPWIFVTIYLSLLRLAITVKQGREIQAYKLIKKRSR